MNGSTIVTALCAAGLLLTTTACKSRAASEPGVTYESDIRKLTVKQCRECHGPKSPSLAEFKKDKEGYKKKDLGPRMDTYETLTIFVNGPDTGALMRRLDDGTNTKDGKPGNMNENLGDTPEERAANLTIFKAWVGGWTLKRSAQISEAERAAIKAPKE